MGAVRLADLLAPVSVRRVQPRLSALETWRHAGVVPGLPRPLFRPATACAGRASSGLSAAIDLFAIVFSARNPPPRPFFIYGSALLGAALPVTAGGVWRWSARWSLAAVGVAGAARLPIWFLIPATVISALIGAVTSRRRVNEAGERQAAAGAGRSRAAREGRRARAHRARSARPARPHAVGGRAEERAGAEADVARSRLARGRRWRKSSGSLATGLPRCARRSPAIDRRACGRDRARAPGARQRRASTRPSKRDRCRSHPAQETALSLALREAATNVIRHAAATTLPHPLLRAGRLGADGSGRQRARRRCAVRQRPDRHARAHSGAGRRACSAKPTAARGCRSAAAVR